MTTPKTSCRKCKSDLEPAFRSIIHQSQTKSN